MQEAQNVGEVDYNPENQPMTHNLLLSEISPTNSNTNVVRDVQIHELDIGNFLDISTFNNDELLYKVLTQPWVPETNYNFKNDVPPGSRIFRREWLSTFPFLSYSAKFKGVFCKYCVLFKPHLDRGLQGRFIKKQFTKYKDIHESARNHQKSKWHVQAIQNAENFKNISENKRKSVIQLANSSVHYSKEKKKNYL